MRTVTRLVFFLFALAGLGVGPAAWADPAAATHRFCVVNGARLYVEILGKGPPILFLHGGLLFFDSNFRNQRDYFATFRTVIGIDQRGHGHSPDVAGPISYQIMADDTAAVLQQLGVGPVDVVGHSDGGDVALLLARDHPELVRRVVISGANLRSGLTAAETERRRRWSHDELMQKVKALAATLPPIFRTGYAQVSPDGPDHWLELVAKDYQMWLTPVVIAPTDLRRIVAPVLVMAGDHDFTSIEETVEIWRDLPHAQLIIIPGTGHGTFSQRPDLVNLAIRDFLEEPAPTAPAH